MTLVQCRFEGPSPFPDIRLAYADGDVTNGDCDKLVYPPRSSGHGPSKYRYVFPTRVYCPTRSRLDCAMRLGLES
jgi:hypothetical protein